MPVAARVGCAGSAVCAACLERRDPRCARELPAVRARGLAARGGPVRSRHEPSPRPPRRLPDRVPVVDLRAAARRRLPQARDGAHLQGHPARHEGHRPGCPGPGADGRGRERHRARAPARSRRAGARGRGDARPRGDPGRARLMDVLVPLPVALPLFAAAVLAAVSPFVPAWFGDLVAAVVSAAVTVIGVVLLTRTGAHDLVYWFGGWKPSHGVALGIAFDVDGAGAALSALAAFLTTATVAFSWRYCDEPGPLQGALSFGIVNGIGAFFLLFGIGLLYGRTGALNLAQIGRSLAGGRADGLVLVAFLLVTAGFLVKAGVVPFHFWLADAYAVAPAPVCVLYSGVMSDLGLHAVAKVYWPVFSGPIGAHATALRAILVTLGVVSALVGAGMAFLQRDLKRMLAFVTIGQIGIGLVGIGLLTARSLGGMTLYVVSDGLVRGSLLLVVGVLVRRLRSCDELEARGRGLRLSAILFSVGALAIAGLPPMGTFFGRALIADGATGGYRWL